MTREELYQVMKEELTVNIYGDVNGQEEVVAYVMKEYTSLQEEIDRLRDKLSDASWKENPDRMGGQFTEEEMNRGWGSNGW